ncbi:MAG: hypothetical protein ACR2IF_13740 [Terriglobales bacterium]
MAEHGFPLPGSSYKELIKIIQGYASISDAASLEDVSKAIGMNPTIVSSNNRFLIAAGILNPGKKKQITPLGADLALALQHEMQDEISGKWRTIVDANEFFQKIVAAVRIRKGMDESTLDAHVAYSAGQPKTQGVLTGAGAVVDILKTSGALKEDAGNLVAVSPEVTRQPETVQLSIGAADAMTPPAARSQRLPMPTTNRLPGGGMQLNIEVRIQCTPQDLDSLGQKLRKVLDDFNRAVDESNSDDHAD